MSTSSTPIPPHRFAEALIDLPVENLYSKAAEIRNAVSHLQSSNQQLEIYARGEEGDRDCAEAIDENGVTIRRMRERLNLLRREVEGRGLVWHSEDSEEIEETEGEDGEESRGSAMATAASNGQTPSSLSSSTGQTGSRTNNHAPQGGGGGGVTGQSQADDDDGVHL